MWSEPGAILERQRRRESSARTYARWLDVVPVRAAGAEVEGADGRRYLDCLAGAGALPLGHNHPEVVAALRDALDRGAPMQALDAATAEKDELVETLFATLPPAFLATDPRIQFCGPAGTDAVEAAIKLTQTATGRGGLLAFTGGYHGMTSGALAASGGVAPRRALGRAALDVVRLPFPHPYRCPFGLGDRDGEVAADYAERLLDDPEGGVLPAALMLVEPVQGEGGVVPAPDGWLRRMRALCDRHGVPLVIDEVQTGVGRTGRLWGHEHAGVVPDALVVSKAVGGGLPLAAVVYRGDLDGWAPGAHAGTFRGTTLAMVAGATTLRIVRRDGLAERAASLGDRIAGGLRRALAGQPLVGEVRGRGLMLGVEVVDPTVEPDRLGSRPPAPERARAVRGACLERGLIAELGGREGSVLRLLPPLTLTDEQAERVVETVAEAFAAAGDER
ncbi:diaminobutyrate--2-oxoglutarate transaminase family protein [Patulibacter defluvii]|uniref:diaminobutyrate--2-oxoglutarate transaminase family protein n=1 Tax=Patulibacter defluvii TaxID=3095358 RepID=UPI002A7500B0|nr:diaminobutyrate--2-oxoglutarate transaminase family protein [Patulibacter sp. DM4]